MTAADIIGLALTAVAVVALIGFLTWADDRARTSTPPTPETPEQGQPS